MFTGTTTRGRVPNTPLISTGWWYLVRWEVAEPLLLHAQLTHLGHELMGADEETRAEQEGEDVRPLRRKTTILREYSAFIFRALWGK